MKTIQLTKRERSLLLNLINRAEVERDRKILDAQGVPYTRRKLPPLTPAAFRALELIKLKLLEIKLIDELE